MNTPAYFCHGCGGQLRWVEQYHRWWCDRCQMYIGTQTDGISRAIDDIGRTLDREIFSPLKPAPSVCNRCGRYARWIPEYQRWYCDGCAAYI